MKSPFSAILKLVDWIVYFFVSHANTETMKCKKCKDDKDEEVLLIQYKGDTIVSIKIKEEK